MAKIMKISGYTAGLFIAAALAALSVSCSMDKPEIPQIKKEDHEPGGDVSGSYSFSIAAGAEDNGTRAYLDPADYRYYWTMNDQVGLTISPAGSLSPASLIAADIRMTSDHSGEDPVPHTTFSGPITQEQIYILTSDELYDYYSYFPYDARTGGTFPNIEFGIPPTLYLTPNGFDPRYAPMVSEVQSDLPPVVYLVGQGFEQGELVHFDYMHLLSYAAIEMDVRLFPEKVNSIKITSSGTPLWGTYVYDMSEAEAADGYTGGGNTITISISGGLTVGSGTVLYVPMPPGDMSNENMTFEFSGPGANSYITKTIKGANFQRGKIHKLLIAPAARYTGNASFTVTKPGYYYIEAWGGDGGSSSYATSQTTIARGGSAHRISGLYEFAAGTTVNLYVGRAGTSTAASGTTGDRPAGGTNGCSFGSGGNGGHGGSPGTASPGGKGGGGGAGTFLFLGGTSASDIRLVSGGGGGGGGSSESNTAHYGGAGGAGGDANQNGASGGSEGHSRSGSGGSGGGTGGSGANNGGAGSATTGAGGNGGNGIDGAFITSGGAGGGGGGGGYQNGGGGGGGGDNSLGGNAGAGGGGAGGASYLTDTTTKTGFTAPSNDRPSDRRDGYAVITFVR